MTASPFWRGVLEGGQSWQEPIPPTCANGCCWCARGRLSRAKIAALFQVAESTVYRWLQAWRSEGRGEAKPHAGTAAG